MAIQYACVFCNKQWQPLWATERKKNIIKDKFVFKKFVLKIINSASAKFCELDPIPTTLLYENLDIL